MRLISIILCLALSACAMYPGGVTDKVSQFDGARTITMNAGYVYASSALELPLLRLGLSWSSTSPDLYLISAEVRGVHNFDTLNTLEIRFGEAGEVVTLSPVPGTFTHHAYSEFLGGSFSSRSYPASRELAQRMVSTPHVMVRFASVYEGEFSLDHPQSAIGGFREVLSRTAPGAVPAQAVSSSSSASPSLSF